MDEKIIVNGINYVVREIENRDLGDLNYLLNDIKVLKFCMGSPFSKPSKNIVERLLSQSIDEQKGPFRTSFDLVLEPDQKGEGIMGIICLEKILKSPNDIRLRLVTRGDYIDDGYPIRDALSDVIEHCVRRFGTNGFYTYIPQRVKSYPLQDLFEDLGFQNTTNTKSRAYYKLLI